MVDNDLIISKIKSIQKCLKRIKDVTRFDPKSLEDIDVQDIFTLNLQRAIQSTLDLASHIVASEGFGMPDSLKEDFIILEKANIISRELTNKMVKMVGFRNIAVHEYQELDVEMLKSILQYHITDLEEFYTAIVKHFAVNHP
ncbi:MAG: DUF86 domain-containing protein [Bacteroidota bacterium]|nr:DUF86 domain-containing protein [Bacteroidota bacterium]